MKSFFVLIATILCVQPLVAQSTKKVLPVTAAHGTVLSGLLHANTTSRAAARTTTLVERLKAMSTRDNTLGSLNDSVNFRYSGYRGSIYDFNTMIYPNNYPYAASPMFNFAGTFTKPQVLFDTMMHWEVDPNTLVYGYYETGFAALGTTNNLVNYKNLFKDSAFYPNKTYTNKFTPADNISEAYSFNFHSGISDSAFKQYFTYNAANKLVQDSTYELHLGVWRIASKTYYGYDAANNPIQIDNYANTTDTSFLLPLPQQLKYVNTFDGSNRLLTVLTYIFDGASLTQSVKDTFAYTGAYTYHSAWREHQWDPINHYWAPMFNMTKIINVGTGLPDTVYIKGFDSIMNAWVPQTMDVMNYNTYNDPVTLKDYEYNWTSYPTTPTFTTTYYYETFTPTSVQQTASVGSARVFPNPATSDLSIIGLDIADNTLISVSFVNLAGQVTSRESVRWHSSATISVRHLVPGLYQMIVQDGKGNMLHHQAVVKD
jgi:hypothetical protein